jgi:hypothetical protein
MVEATNVSGWRKTLAYPRPRRSSVPLSFGKRASESAQAIAFGTTVVAADERQQELRTR